MQDQYADGKAAKLWQLYIGKHAGPVRRLKSCQAVTAMSDEVRFVGVQLINGSISKFFTYSILLDTPYHSCTTTKQT